MKQKYIIIGLILVVVAIVGIGVYFMMKSGQPTATVEPKNQEQEQKIYNLTPDDIGLTITHKTYTKGSSSGPGLHLEATKISDISTLSCEIQYTHTNSTGDDQQEGLICNIDVKAGMNTIDQDFALGTCSDVCHFHTNIKDIKALIKVTKKDGKIYQIEQSVSNPQ